MARTVTSAVRTIFESKARVAYISRKTNDDRDHSRFQIFTFATWLFSADQARIIALASACVSATTKNELQGRQNFTSVTSAT
jgi:hypothetical protein